MLCIKTRNFLQGARGGKRFILTLSAGMICGFLSACLLISATKDVPHILNWMSSSPSISKDPHHYTELDAEVELKFIHSIITIY